MHIFQIQVKRKRSPFKLLHFANLFFAKYLIFYLHFVLYFIIAIYIIQVKDETTGLELDGRRIRVDYSITQRAHTPTPGVYMGKPSQYV